jgi:hypothetical protein
VNAAPGAISGVCTIRCANLLRTRGVSPIASGCKNRRKPEIAGAVKRGTDERGRSRQCLRERPRFSLQLAAGRRRRRRPGQPDPDSAILSGKVENGSIRFHVDRTIGKDINGCAIASLTLTPFGPNQLAAEWQDGGTCHGGHVILRNDNKLTTPF